MIGGLIANGRRGHRPFVPQTDRTVGRRRMPIPLGESRRASSVASSGVFLVRKNGAKNDELATVVPQRHRQVTGRWEEE